MTEKIKHSRLFLWFVQVLRVCGRELLLVFRDEGVVIFFLVLNAVYPVLYALIYNPEVVRNERVVVVDDNRTAQRGPRRRCTARPATVSCMCHATSVRVWAVASRVMCCCIVT